MLYSLNFLKHLLLIVIFVVAISSISLANNKNAQNKTPKFSANVFKIKANNSRSDTIDILNYSIDLNITNFTSKVISGSCTVRFAAKVNGVNQLDLDLLKLSVDSVKQHDSLVAISYNDTLLKTNLLHVLSVSDTDSVTVYYHGVPQQDATGWGGFYFSTTYAYNLGVGFGADPHAYGRIWFPCFDNFVERSTYTFTITTAAGKKAACNGVLLQHQVNLNTTETWTWRLDESIPSYLACVAIAAYKTVHQNFNGVNGMVPVELQGVAADTTNIKNSFTHLENAFHIYEQRYGPYRWGKIGYSFVPFTGGAMEHATNIAYPRTFANGSLAYESFMVHEFSHHWWGDLITCKTQEDMWINEGMASFSEELFVENWYGKSFYIANIKSNLNEILHFTHQKEGGYRAISGIPHDLTYGDHVYLKGKAVAHTLRGYMGDSLFFLSIKALMNNRKFSAVTSYDMRDELENASGLNLHAFFDNWVFSPGFPHFSVDSFAVTGSGIPYQTSVSIRQKLTGAPNYFTQVPLELTFFDSLWNSYTTQVTMSGKAAAFTVQVPFQAKFAAVNYNQKLCDAVSSETQIIKTTGLHNFANARMSLTVQSIPDSAFVRIEHNWTAPDSLKDASKHFQLSPNRYWKVDGIFSNGFVASAKLIYDGRTIGFTGNSYLDNALITGKEDSLVLLYRANAGEDWLEYSSYTKTIGNPNDRTGSITIDSLKKGEYTLALKNGPLAIEQTKKTSPTDFRIYPNPAGNKLTIELLQDKNNYSDIDIYDSSLKLFESYKVQNGQNNLVVSSIDWPNGIYFVIITHHISQQTILQKVVIQHQNDSAE